VSAVAASLGWVLLATLAGAALASLLPWHAAARRAGLPAALAIVLGPLLAGLASVAAVALVPFTGADLLPAVALGLLLLLLPLAVALPGLQAATPVDRGLGLAALGSWWPLALPFAVLLGFEAVVVPLTQNDPLEYATVARIVGDAGSLWAYPAVHPEATRSGFFGPWTHPPLYVAWMAVARTLGDGDVGLRWLAGWCLLAAMAGVHALGRLQGPTTARVASVLFAATPILLLGAASSSIDPLPVLGMVLSLLVACGIGTSAARTGAWIGAALGLALWTHSQAVLFPVLLAPLLAVLVWGAPAGPGASRRPAAARAGRFAVAGGAGLLAMVAIGGAWYLRNIALFGSPISDTPAVFAEPALQFATYFSVQRGFTGPLEVLLYGVLKGFFAFDGYGVVFWLALAGLPAAWRALRGAGAQPVLPVAGAALLLAAFYGAVVVASVLAGVDLMIRNDRYLQVVLPAVALLAGVGVQQLGQHGHAGRLLALGLALLLPLQAAVLWYRQSPLRVPDLPWQPAQQLARWSQFDISRAIATETAPDSRVFSLRPADMYYADRPMVSYIDPRMLPLYRSGTDPAAALAALRSLGVTHVHLGDYLLPPVYMTGLMGLLADPGRSRLVAERDGYQLFALQPEPDTRDDVVQARAVAGAWVRRHDAVLGGRKSRVRKLLLSEPYTLGARSTNTGLARLLWRESANVLRSPPIELGGACTAGRRLADLTATVQLRGQGAAMLLVELQGADGQVVERRLLGDRPALPAQAPTSIVRRFGVPEGVGRVVMEVEHRGQSELVLDEARLLLRCTAAAAPGARMPASR